MALQGLARNSFANACKNIDKNRPPAGRGRLPLTVRSNAPRGPYPARNPGRVRVSCDAGLGHLDTPDNGIGT